MDFVQGVIEKIQTKEIPADQWGNTWQRSLKINGDFFGVGKGKKPVVSVKHGQEWVDLKEGMTVKFMVKSREYQGKTFYDKEGNITILKGSSGAVSPPAAGDSVKAAPAARASYGSGDKGIKIGHALTNAVQLFVAGKIDNVEDAAWEILKLSEKMNVEYESRMSGAAAETGESKPATPKASASRGATSASSISTASRKPAAATKNQDDDFPDTEPF
jgi:hypothetical protein